MRTQLASSTHVPSLRGGAVALAILAFFFVSFPAYAQIEKPSLPEMDVHQDVVIVKFKEGWENGISAGKTGNSAVDQVVDKFGIHTIRRALPILDKMTAGKRQALKGMDGLGRIYRMEYQEGHDPRQVAMALSGLPGVEYAEPLPILRPTLAPEPSFLDFIRQPAPYLAEPNDPLYQQMTHLQQISAPAAWDVIKAEGQDIVVAVIDGGTDWRHSDIEANIWINPGEVENGADDDGNGFIDDVRGWNFPFNSNDPTGLTATPINAGHGTNVAGVVSAISDNNEGVAGVSWNAKILPINVSSPSTDNSLGFGFEGVIYATGVNADIINLSWGSFNDSQFGREVVNAAVANDIVVISSAGNSAEDADVIGHYPANYPNVLSIGATQKSGDVLASFSTYGMIVDMYAPGQSLDTIEPNNSYGVASGTSFSSPLTAGVGALVRAKYPDMTELEVREQLRVTTDDIRASNSIFRYRGNVGRGRLNAARAVTEKSPSVRVVDFEVVDTSGDGFPENGEVVEVNLYLTNHLEDVSNLTIGLDTRDFRTDPLGSASLASLAKGDTAMVRLNLSAQKTEE